MTSLYILGVYLPTSSVVIARVTVHEIKHNYYGQCNLPGFLQGTIIITSGKIWRRFEKFNNNLHGIRKWLNL